MADRRDKPSKPGFVLAGRVAEFSDQPMRAVRIAGKPVAVFRRADDSFYALEMACKHQNADLTRSPIVNQRVTCARHGWQYDVVTGECLDHDAPRLRQHAVEVEEDHVFVAMTPERRMPGA